MFLILITWNEEFRMLLDYRQRDRILSGPQIKAGMSQNIPSLKTMFAFRYVFLSSFFIFFLCVWGGFFLAIYLYVSSYIEEI